MAISVATVFRNTLSTPALWIASREFENKLPMSAANARLRVVHIILKYLNDALMCL